MLSTGAARWPGFPRKLCRLPGWLSCVHGPTRSRGTSHISDLCHIDIPQESGCKWKCMTSQLTEEDFLLEEEGVDSPERWRQN